MRWGGFIGGRLSALAQFFCIQAMSYRFEYSTNLATGPPIPIYVYVLWPTSYRAHPAKPPTPYRQTIIGLSTMPSIASGEGV